MLTKPLMLRNINMSIHCLRRLLSMVKVLAVMLVTEAQNRLRSRAIPEAFRGLPITLIYIGVLALAIYGFTGHSVIL